MNGSQKLLEILTVEEKIRLFNGQGSWKTYDADGKLPYFVMSDGPHGLRKQEDEKYADINKSKIATCFPTASCIASSWNRDTAKKLGKALAKEAKAENVNMVLGPGINIKRSPLCGRNFEYFSEDPYLAGTLAADYINEMQKYGVGACVKHFACNNQEKRRQSSNSIIDGRTLREIYLRAFEIVVKKSEPAGIMGSYNRINGDYACANKKLLTEILRNQWKYKGIVISDWGACINAAKCVEAGLNLAMPDSNGYLTAALKKALADKIITETQIDQAVKPVLDTALFFKENQFQETGNVDYTEQHQIAKELAEDSAVLLKNNNFLPLAKGKIVIIGELAQFMKFQGCGSSHISTREYPNAIQALKDLGFELLYSKGYYSGFCKKSKVQKKNRPLAEQAIKLVETAAKENIPVLFFSGLTEIYEGEGFDRKNLNLPEEQIQLLNKILEITENVAVINFSGAPVNFESAKKAKAILQMYLPGESAGEATAELIAGIKNPGGKLAETFPFTAEQSSCHKNFALEQDNVEYRETVFTGYRYYESENIPVQYEFGFGLSYTTFQYKDLKIDRDDTGKQTTVSLSVTNTGNYDGSETVQIYVKPVQTEEEKKFRPSKELRGFEKVFLKKGETKNISVSIDDNAFKIYSEKAKDFITIGGEYIIQAGASIKDIRLEEKISVEGEKLLENCGIVPEDFYATNRIPSPQKGNYSVSNSLNDMAENSGFIRMFIKILEMVLVLMNKGKSKDDPSVKIAICAIRENPLESLISTSGGAISEKTAKFLLKMANK